jgi:hypothetical protein
LSSRQGALTLRRCARHSSTKLVQKIGPPREKNFAAGAPGKSLLARRRVRIRTKQTPLTCHMNSLRQGTFFSHKLFQAGVFCCLVKVPEESRADRHTRCAMYSHKVNLKSIQSCRFQRFRHLPYLVVCCTIWTAVRQTTTETMTTTSSCLRRWRTSSLSGQRRTVPKSGSFHMETSTFCAVRGCTKSEKWKKIPQIPLFHVEKRKFHFLRTLAQKVENPWESSTFCAPLRKKWKFFPLFTIFFHFQSPLQQFFFFNPGSAKTVIALRVGLK